MAVYNLTPYTVVVLAKKRNEYPSVGYARVEQKASSVGVLPDGSPLVKVEYGLLQTNHPPLAAGDAVLVSTLAAPMCIGYFTTLGVTVLVPDSSPASAIRDATGQIIGVRRLIQHG